MLLSQSQNSRVFAAYIFVVFGQIFLQRLFPTSSSLPPGPARGDIELPENCLPKTINDWKNSSFTSPDKTETDRVWATSWAYHSDHGTALVSFDQAAYTGWHELSNCYVAIGWEHKTRNSFMPSEHGWPYVVSTFTTKTGQTAVVIFSLFYDNGDFAHPPTNSLSRPTDQKNDVLDRLGGRFSELHPVNLRQDPTRQCQVLFIGHEITDQIKDAVTELHLESRERFLQHWTFVHTNPGRSSDGDSK